MDSFDDLGKVRPAMHMHSALVVIDLKKNIITTNPQGKTSLKLSLLLRENLFSFK